MESTVGDRSLVSALVNGDLRRQLSRWDLDELGETKGVRVYGHARSPDASQRGGDDGAAIGRLCPSWSLAPMP